MRRITPMLTILFVIIIFINLPVITRKHSANATRNARGARGTPEQPEQPDLRVLVRGLRLEAHSQGSGTIDERRACLASTTVRLPDRRPPRDARCATSPASAAPSRRTRVARASRPRILDPRSSADVDRDPRRRASTNGRRSRPRADAPRPRRRRERARDLWYYAVSKACVGPLQRGRERDVRGRRGQPTRAAARATDPVERALTHSTRNERARERTNGTDLQTRVPSQYPQSKHGNRVHDLRDFLYWTGFLFLHRNRERGREETSAAAAGAGEACRFASSFRQMNPLRRTRLSLPRRLVAPRGRAAA